jgi:hypothetical protein
VKTLHSLSRYEYYDIQFQDSELRGASVAPTSEVRAQTLLLLLFVGNWEVQLWNDPNDWKWQSTQTIKCGRVCRICIYSLLAMATSTLGRVWSVFHEQHIWVSTIRSAIGNKIRQNYLIYKIFIIISVFNSRWRYFDV